MLDSTWQKELCQLDSQNGAFLSRALPLLYRLDPNLLNDRDLLVAGIVRLIAEIDRRISLQLSEVIHHPDFCQLEAAWRSVETLVQLPVNYQKTRVKLLDLTWFELSHELNNAPSLKRSMLYNLIANRELNTSGGQPFGMLVVDHGLSMSLDNDYDDLYTVELLASLGELCLCPFVLSLEPEFFGESGADWLSDLGRMDKILQGPDFAEWQRLRRLNQARFVGVTLPQVRLRDAYAIDASRKIRFTESHQEQPGLWGQASVLFASIAMREFNRINWFGFMKSRWQDKAMGALVNVPQTGIGTSASYTPQPDIAIYSEMGHFYAEQGFIPLCRSVTTDKYFFRGNRSIWALAQNDAELVSGQLQTTLMICRIAHFLKMQIRGMIGNFQSAEECERYLNDWLQKYTSNLFNADEATMAKYPLSKSRVEVKPVNGQKDRYICNVLVQPQYQYDNVCGEVLLSTDLGREETLFSERSM
ncbi:type VI secretion system contractile sheath large subunit [Vibrio sp. SM6]|uniref:Type VI secretion system contractile sheath large subunit n=1 Tax=Vibrio agarilyticus TaxID=2726741 RepID=A0A7X8TN31_9VIBR|nr:type VI secretion system contractile sheath large subunit [Vibrio agarilyticus]NLS11780.1 type VI secretion system contractile sheath large subunit [Vibrio agarilyticus]